MKNNIKKIRSDDGVILKISLKMRIIAAVILVFVCLSGLGTLLTVNSRVKKEYIAKSELVDVQLVEGNESVTDKAAAIKVILKSGREDYIVYATNTDCLYRVDDKFDFMGFAGVVSYADGKLTYAYGNEAKQVAGIVKTDMPAITGTVVDFTRELADNYTMTIKVDQAVTAEDLEGRYIYVDNDRVENGAYRIYGAQVKGSIVVLDLYTQDMIRNYVDATDLDSGFVYNIAEGQRFTIPMSSCFDIGAYFTYTPTRLFRRVIS